MPLIAMTREMGSLGKDVAQGIAEALGLEVVHHEIIDHLADKMRLRKSHVVRLLDGKATMFERLTADRTSLAIFTAGRNGHLHDWLNFRWLQYLGKISYSLYLIHYAVSHVVTHVGWSLLGGSPSPPQAAACLAVALASSIAVAHVLYECVEVPSTRWAARLKLATSASETRKEQTG